MCAESREGSRRSQILHVIVKIKHVTIGRVVQTRFHTFARNLRPQGRTRRRAIVRRQERSVQTVHAATLVGRRKSQRD